MAAEDRKYAALEKDALRYRALRPYLQVGETEDGERWALWCLAKDGSDCECVSALYAREALTDAEDSRAAAGEPNWGPDCDAMVDELATRALRGDTSGIPRGVPDRGNGGAAA